MRCFGVRVFLTPSHVNESFTAAIVVRSLLAAERSDWRVGLLVGEVVVRRKLVWPVSWDVVVAVGISVSPRGEVVNSENGYSRSLFAIDGLKHDPPKSRKNLPSVHIRGC